MKLDFETKASYRVAVAVDDATIGTSPDATSALFNLAVNNVSPEIITGTAGKDTLKGGPDRDIITGGLGKDTLTGGAGSDVFLYRSIKDSGKMAVTRDVITDFKHGQDKIELSAIDAIAGTKKNDAFKFIGTSGFHDVKGELHYFKIDAKGTAHDATIVEGDINGDGNADFQIELSHLVTLIKGDFIL